MLPSRVVLGVAADISSGGTKTTTISDASGISANQTTVFDSETVRGRFGYAADNILFYATGGFAWSNAQFVRTQLTGALNNATAGTDEAVNKGLMGWTAAAVLLTPSPRTGTCLPNIDIRVLDRRRISLPFSQLTTTSTTNISAVEFGVNYKFTPGRAVQLACQPAPYARGRRHRHWSTNRPLLRYRLQLEGFYFGGDGGFGWETVERDFDGRGGRSSDALQLQRERSGGRGVRRRQLSVRQSGARRRGRLAMVQPDSATIKSLRHSARPALFRPGPLRFLRQ